MLRHESQLTLKDHVIDWAPTFLATNSERFERQKHVLEFGFVKPNSHQMHWTYSLTS